VLLRGARFQFYKKKQGREKAAKKKYNDVLSGDNYPLLTKKRGEK